MRPGQPPEPQITVRVTLDDYRRIRLAAAREGCSRSVYIRRLLDIGLHTKFNMVLEPLQKPGRPRKRP